MAFKFSLQVLFLVLASIAPHVILARELHSHSHKYYPRLFPQHLEGSGQGNNIEGIHDVKIYLQRYGYLINNVQSNDNAFDDVLESAIKKYQKFFQLNVSGILDGKTLDLMSKPRCGVADFFTNDNEDGQEHNFRVNGSHYTLLPNRAKWPDSKHHLTFGLINHFPREFIPSVARALKNWSLRTGVFRFSPAMHWPTADIKLSFERRDHGDGAPFDGRGGVQAHAAGPNDGRVHFDADENWSVEVVPGRLNFEMVALHELGHILGLGHSSLKEAIMWPYADLGVTKGLHSDDIEGIRALYN